MSDVPDEARLQNIDSRAARAAQSCEALKADTARMWAARYADDVPWLRARISTLEAENARLRADLERVTGERDDQAAKLRAAVQDIRASTGPLVRARDESLNAARRDLEEARLVLEAVDRDVDWDHEGPPGHNAALRAVRRWLEPKKPAR